MIFKQLRLFNVFVYFGILAGLAAAQNTGFEVPPPASLDAPSLPKEDFAPKPAPATPGGLQETGNSLQAGELLSVPAADTQPPAATFESSAVPAATADFNALTARQFETPEKLNEDRQARNDPQKRQRSNRNTGSEMSVPVLPRQQNAVLTAQPGTALPVFSSQPADHPLARYLSISNVPGITGKPLSVAELLRTTRSAASRNSLLQAYWDLSGKLAIYNIQSENGVNPQIAALEFVKSQWQLAERLKRYKGIEIRENELPVPTDFPLYQRYETFADQIARTDRTEYLAKVLPIQKQLIDAKINTATLDGILDLVNTIVEYNKMIAEYASETISPNISQEQLVGAVIKLPKPNATSLNIPLSAAEQPIQQASYREY